jgi:hypothetical protein
MERENKQGPTIMVFLSDRRNVSRLLQEEPIMHSLARTAIMRLPRDQRKQEAHTLLQIAEKDPHEERRKGALVLFDLLNPSLDKPIKIKPKKLKYRKVKTFKATVREQKMSELWADHSISEIAELMDISENTVSIIATRARKKGLDLPARNLGRKPKHLSDKSLHKS